MADHGPKWLYQPDAQGAPALGKRPLAPADALADGAAKRACAAGGSSNPSLMVGKEPVCLNATGLEAGTCPAIGTPLALDPGPAQASPQPGGATNLTAQTDAAEAPVQLDGAALPAAKPGAAEAPPQPGSAAKPAAQPGRLHGSGKATRKPKERTPGKTIPATTTNKKKLGKAAREALRAAREARKAARKAARRAGLPCIKPANAIPAGSLEFVKQLTSKDTRLWLPEVGLRQALGVHGNTKLDTLLGLEFTFCFKDGETFGPKFDTAMKGCGLMLSEATRYALLTKFEALGGEHAGGQLAFRRVDEAGMDPPCHVAFDVTYLPPEPVAAPAQAGAAAGHMASLLAAVLAEGDAGEECAAVGAEAATGELANAPGLADKDGDGTAARLALSAQLVMASKEGGASAAQLAAPTTDKGESGGNAAAGSLATTEVVSDGGADDDTASSLAPAATAGDGDTQSPANSQPPADSQPPANSVAPAPALGGSCKEASSSAGNDLKTLIGHTVAVDLNLSSAIGALLFFDGDDDATRANFMALANQKLDFWRMVCANGAGPSA